VNRDELGEQSEPLFFDVDGKQLDRNANERHCDAQSEGHMFNQSVEFWQAVSALSSIILIAITGVYAYLTHRLVRAAEEQAWEANRAHVIAKISTNQGGQLLLLHFENIGKAAAKNLSVKLDKPVHKRLGSKDDLREMPFIKSGLSYFPPGTPVKYSIAASHQWLGETVDRSLHPKNFVVELEYSTLGRLVNESVKIDVVDQLFMSAIDRDYIDDFGRQFPDKFSKGIDSVVRKLDAMVDHSPPRIVSRKSWAGWFHKQRASEKWFNRW
jgi:hypothetical protein